MQTDLVVMLARPEFLLPLAFTVSGLMIMAALVLLRISARQSKQAYRVVGPHYVAQAPERANTMRMDAPQRPERGVTLPLFSGATVAALDEVRQNPARKRQVRMYA